MTSRILIVSDQHADVFLGRALTQQGFVVVTAQSFEAGRRQLQKSSFDLIIVDMAEPLAGAEFIRQIRAQTKPGQVMVLTIAEWGTGEPTLALTAGADAFEPKPIDVKRFVGAVQRLLTPNLAKTATANRESND
jgi:two-component system phosphate regulon response regulator OmpR